jgi:hypothetical protein
MALGLTQPLTEISTKNISWGQRRPVRKADNLTNLVCRLSWNLGASTSGNHLGLSRLLMWLLYFYLYLPSYLNNHKGTFHLHSSLYGAVSFRNCWNVGEPVEIINWQLPNKMSSCYSTRAFKCYTNNNSGITVDTAMDFRYDKFKLEDYKWNWKAIFGWTVEKDIM